MLAAIGAIAYMAYKASFQKVTLSFDATGGTTVNLYSRNTNSKDLPIKQGGVVHTFTATETITLQKGEYITETNGTNVKKDPAVLIVGDSPVEKTIPIKYTEEYLAQKLSQEQPSITQAIVDQFKNVQTLYTIQPGKLFGKGEWYGTALVYKGSSRDYRDTLHLVLRKTDVSWTVVNTPQISLSAADNKDIPKYILSEVNTYSASPSEAPPTPKPDYVINDGSPGAQ